MNIGLLPLLSSVISFIFAVTVLDQFFARRRPYQLIWAIGLFMYFISTGTEFWTHTWGLNETIFRLWYLFGAILVAAYLGMGTIYLLTPRRTAHIVMAVLLVATLYSTFRVFNASVNLSVIAHLSGNALPDDVRAMPRYFSYAGTVALMGGAIYSSWVFWRRKILPHRMLSNILIAVGVLLPAIGGGIMRAIGAIQLFYMFELLGIIIIFIGFLRNREVFGFYRFPLIHGLSKISN
ncbi:MAG: hypothetical protein HY529_04135 [Chloroflexi bacterium]|nr:hypothetical protein [Chloroflexota bacterium]